MHLLLVNYEYPPIGGGAATAAAEMARSAVAMGHEVTVLTSAFGGNHGWRTEDGVVLRRVRSLRERAERSSTREMASFVWRAAFAMPGVIRRSRAEACIIFFSLPCGPLGLLFKVLAGRPYVVSLRGGDVPGTEPHLDGMHRRLRFLRRLVLSHAAAIVANSAGLAELSQRADALPAAVIPNGVDVSRFCPAQLRPPDPFCFLFVGRLSEQKNVALLLDAAAELYHRAEGGFRLRIVGDGPLRDRLGERAVRLGLAGVVEWVRWLPRERMPETYRSAHCVVNPSHYEGMPNVVLEAMACAVPVIVSDVAGNRDVVVDGHCGLIVAPDNREELALAMAKALSSRGHFESMGANARAHVAARYSWEAATRAYVELLSGPALARQ